jgi:hypothetical protein
MPTTSHAPPLRSLVAQAARRRAGDSPPDALEAPALPQRPGEARRQRKRHRRLGRLLARLRVDVPVIPVPDEESIP